VQINLTPRIDGGELLDNVEDFLSRFVAYPSESARIAHTLWIAHTWFMDSWESTPRIAFLSPAPGSGKSRALEVTEPLVPRPIHAVNTSPGLAYFRLGAWDQYAQRRPEYLPPPYADTLPAVPATDLLVNRLAMPIACTAAARAAPCIRSEAAALLLVLLAAHCRGADHWIREDYGGYEQPQRELVAQVLIELTLDGEPEPLIDHLKHSPPTPTLCNSC
jgi:hypothetical protein